MRRVNPEEGRADMFPPPLTHTHAHTRTHTGPCVCAQFLQCLYVRFDFDGAQEQLRACRAVLENDYFLHEVHTHT
jgi:hypothetical protein